MTFSFRCRVAALTLGLAGGVLAAEPELPRETYTLSGRDAEPVARAELILAGAADPGRSPNFLALPLAGRSGAAVLFADGDAQGLRWSLGGSLQDQPGQRADFEGTGLSYPFGPGRLYASVERRHWGPSPFGSLILDGAARALPALGWRKTSGEAFDLPVLKWLGPWRTDLFAGQLSNDVGPSAVKLLGWRVEIEPWRGVVLGGSRVLQWGGAGRPQTLGSLARAILGIDNFEAGTDRSVEPGNQLAGFDARWTLPWGEPLRFTLNGQAIGEDEAGHMPSRYIVSGGGEVAGTLADGTALRVFGELADTQIDRWFRGSGFPGSAYHHSLYPAGYAQRNQPLAYPAGGDVRIASLGLAAQRGTTRLLLMLHRGDEGRRGLAGELRHAFDGGPTLALAATEWHDALGRERGLQVRVEIPLERLRD